MALNKWILFAVLFVVTWLFLSPMLGITGGLVHTILLTLAIAAILSYFGIFSVFPFALKKTWLGLIGIAILAFFVFEYGWLTELMPGAIPGVPGASPAGPCVVSAELQGKTSTITPYAWDLESNTPYSSAIDFSTSCWMYKNGNTATDYVVATTNTNDSTGESGFVVGDVLYMYCGGTTYYGDPIENLCIDKQAMTVNIKGHTIIGEADAQITAYDSTGATALDAVGSTNYGDYNLTLGAGGEESIYVKLKVNVANEAYQFCAWGVALFYNVTSVEPQDAEATYTEVFTPTHMKSVAVEVNTTSETLSKDYTMWKADQAIMLREWDSIKEQFVAEAHATNDPVDRQTTSTAGTMNGFAIIAKDCTYARGDDGGVHFDFYAHTTAQADVGLDETETSPRGKQVGVQICLL